MTLLDLSQYDLPLDARCLKAAGVTDVILGVYSPTNPPEPMADAAQSLLDVGITVHGWYALIYFGSPFGVTRDTKWAAMLARRFGVNRVWLDCEIDASAVGFTDAVTPTPASRVAEIQACRKLVEDAGLSPGIYSAPWWWRPNTGNSTEFSDLPLWFANYGRNDGTQPPLPTLPEPFGGWTKAAMHQYTSTLSVCGRGRDANYLFEEEDMGLSEDDILAIFGSTERDPQGNLRERAYRLARAKERYEEAVSTGRSVLEVAATGLVTPSGGKLAPGTTFTITGEVTTK